MQTKQKYFNNDSRNVSENRWQQVFLQILPNILGVGVVLSGFRDTYSLPIIIL